MFVDGFIHPIFCLLVAPVFKISVCFYESEIFVNHVPYFLDADAIKSGIGQDFRHPARFGSRKQMKCIAKMSRRQFGFFNVVSIRFIDDNGIRHLHNAALDALQFITRTRQLDKQEKIDHRVYSRFALPHPDSFYKYLIESCRLTKNDGLTRLACHTSQGTSRRTGTDKRIGMHRKFLHTGLVSQDTSFRTLAAGVDGKHRKLASFLQDMQPENIYRSTLACSGHTTYSHTNRIARERQAFFYHFLCQRLMFVLHAFYQRNRLAQYRDVTFQDTFYILARRKLAAFHPFPCFQIRINRSGLFDTFVYRQPFVSIAVLGVFHSFFI